ncbi:vesicular glutamate transporter 2.2 isoform X2 [Halyomorpha halys]|uniref:vesicular glutamate transporter 2.2 isoform X2 n=1 Tax=Halyomorpha halys TaxID=286706 RepID=UPI0006D4DD8B|nr:vesicular glutamate transporter 2.2-like isoform X2 [Halyomorpha halys]
MSMGKLGVRHVQGVLLSTALVVTHMQLGNIGIAVVIITHDDQLSEWKRIFYTPRADPNVDKVSLITGSFFYSQMICSILGGYLSTKINNKILLLTVTCIGVMTSYLTPTLVTFFEWKAFFFVRLVQGAAQGFVKPLVYNMAARWLPTSEMRLMGPGIICGLYMGMCFMLMMGGYLGAGKGGWASIFYFSANCGLLWIIAFYGLGFVSPNDCFYISDLEKDHINNNVPRSVLKPYRHNIPWKMIFTNIPLFALLICHFANNWALHCFIKIMPLYLQQKNNLELHQTGIICGSPFMLSCFNVYATTAFFHYLWRRGQLNHVVVRHVCNAIAQFGAAYCFMLCSASESLVLTLVFHHLGLILSAFQLFGFYMNFYDLSPTYVGLTSGIVGGIANVGSVVGPHFTLKMYNQYGTNFHEWLADREFKGWRLAYDIVSLNYFIAGTAFMFLGEVKEQPFDKSEETSIIKRVKLNLP